MLVAQYALTVGVPSLGAAMGQFYFDMLVSFVDLEYARTSSNLFYSQAENFHYV